MRKLLIRPLAVNDLEDIWLFSQRKWSAAQADRYLMSIHEELKGLASEPESGRSADPIRAGYRMHRVARHVVFYTFTDTTVSVRRVLHARMDFLRHL